ncbi:MAG: ADP-ribosylglycohydrolase family protein [Polyangiaceae bacterium]
MKWESRVVGCVLGAAIGDALGHPTEFVDSFEGLALRFPPSGVTGYELYWEREGQRFAPYTDDTQMAELVLLTLSWAREQSADLDRAMRFLSKRFVIWSLQPQGGHRAPGNACLAGCRMLAAGDAWHEAGGEHAGGCGSVMRAYPAGLVFVDDLEKAEQWAVEQSKLTHRAPIAFAACAAMARATALALRGETAEVVVSAMVEAAARYDAGTARMIEQALDEAARGVEPRVTLQRLQGWAAHECIAAAAYVFARHADSFRDAVLEGANTPGDSDSIATLAGALVGARLGLGAIEPMWVSELERSRELVDLGERCARLVAR